MSDNNQDENLENKDPNGEVVPPKKDETPPKKGDESSNDEEFKTLKGNLSKAYGERDTLKSELEDLKKEKRDAEIQRLKDEGKDREAFDAQLSDKDTVIAGLEKRIIELTRDNEVRQILAGHSLRNERAAELAYDSIIKELVQDEKGTWVHRAGKSVKDFIAAFSEDEDNKFLFKEKENRGTGNPPTVKTDAPPKEQSGKLAGKTAKEIIGMARKGQLPNQRR